MMHCGWKHDLVTVYMEVSCLLNSRSKACAVSRYRECEI